MNTLSKMDPALRKLMPRSSKLAPTKGRESAAKADGGASPSGSSALQPPQLPYAYDALKPQISPETMHYHFDKHYLGYVAKVNTLVAGTEYASMPLEEMIRQAAWKRKRSLQTNAAQVWNHAFFWDSLSPVQDRGPDLVLAEAIAKTFGSVGKFREKFVERGMAHVGSGWLWLAWHSERGLMLRTTENAIPVWLASGRIPLLVCDLWEHAYYLDWKNDRAGWLDAFVTRLANWELASKQYSAAVNGTAAWQYSA